jgi:hypothetical protein
VSDTLRLESYQYIDNRRRDRPGPASARVEEASEQGTSPLHPRAPGRRHLPRPSLQRSSPARSRRRTPMGFAPPRGRPGKLPAARGSIGARSSCRLKRLIRRCLGLKSGDHSASWRMLRGNQPCQPTSIALRCTVCGPEARDQPTFPSSAPKARCPPRPGCRVGPPCRTSPGRSGQTRRGHLTRQGASTNG